ncbi:MAG: hypothetical protein K9N06_11880 [Candidatus Cloacimonetes bacterium]|nr:hypothetical protein [Candidatus Cloacimonadota bacterium]
MQREIEARLGDVFDEKFEKTDVEYSYYTILKGSEIIGRIHGLNQRGRFGGMQLILATDLEGRIVDFYYQKISSPEADKFKAIEFTNQFLGISLQDFYENAQDSTKTRLAQIKDPSQENRQDFEYTLRGIKKNLIQLDFFFLNRIHDKYFNPEKEN